MTARPQLLFLTQRIPYPPMKGEKIRPLLTIQHLRETYDIHLGTLIDDPRDWEHVPAVQALCASSWFSGINRKLANVTCQSGWLTGEPLSVTFYRDRKLQAWVRKVLDEVKPEAIFVFSGNMAPYVLDLKGSERVRLVDLTDVDSEKWRAYAEVAKFPMNWVYRREWKKTAELESRIARECDWCTFVSDDEAALFARQQPGQKDKIRAVSNGVDGGYFDPAHAFEPPFETDRLNFVFTGTMDYPPNVDAVVWFANEILPVIRKSAPSARFHVVGSNPSAEVQALTAIEGVFVTGRVPDVRPYLAYASAAVAPMRIARGIQNKVLEAMSMGRPTVVTRDALEGIAAKPGEDVFLADTVEAFAAACLQAVKPEAAAIGEAARRRVLADYVWAERLRGFDRLLAPGAV